MVPKEGLALVHYPVRSTHVSVQRHSLPPRPCLPGALRCQQPIGSFRLSFPRRRALNRRHLGLGPIGRLRLLRFRFRLSSQRQVLIILLVYYMIKPIDRNQLRGGD